MSQVAPKSDLLQLFMLHRKDLIGYANSIVGEQYSAEDVVQDAYFRVIGTVNRRQDCETMEEPLGYLYQIIRNLCLDVLRRKTRENSYLNNEDYTASFPSSGQVSPEQEAGAREELVVLRMALNDLPERVRLAFELHRFSDMKLKEIAIRLDVSVGTAHSMVATALEHCKNKLRK